MFAKFLPVLFIMLACFYSENAKAYPNFIGHGYTSCINCHYNPFGGGPLTDYARAVAATTISSRNFYPESMTDERLANSSGFLFNKPENTWLRAQINYRGFQLVRNPNSSTQEKTMWINMQADARLILKFGENDRFIAVGNVGYAPPERNAPAGAEEDTWRSREYYMGYKITPKIGVYAGLMDKIYGIRVIEHIAYSRVYPQVTQNDQTHGITGHYIGESWEAGLQMFAGNLMQDAEIRMKGFAATAEKTIFGLHRLGGSFISSENDYLKLNSAALHARMNLKEGSALLFEVGRTTQTVVQSKKEKTSHYGLLQTYLRPARGWYVLNNVEYIKTNIEEDPYSIRWGPGVQYFPFQRLELRFDLYNTRNFSKEASTKDNWMYLFQTHVWL
jgi:hypothetical protein